METPSISIQGQEGRWKSLQLHIHMYNLLIHIHMHNLHIHIHMHNLLIHIHKHNLHIHIHMQNLHIHIHMHNLHIHIQTHNMHIHNPVSYTYVDVRGCDRSPRPALITPPMGGIYRRCSRSLIPIRARFSHHACSGSSGPQ